MILFIWLSGKGKTVGMDPCLPGLKMGEGLTTKVQSGIVRRSGNVLCHDCGGDYVTCVHLSKLFKVYFWLRWVFVAVHGVSLVAESRGYSLAAACGLLTAWLGALLPHDIWNHPGPGIEVSSVLTGGFLTTGSLGKFCVHLPGFKDTYTIKAEFCWCCLVANSCPILLRPHGQQPARLPCPWHSPSKNTGVGCHFLLHGVFLVQGLLHWQVRFFVFVFVFAYHWATREAKPKFYWM